MGLVNIGGRSLSTRGGEEAGEEVGLGGVEVEGGGAPGLGGGPPPGLCEGLPGVEGVGLCG